MRIVKSQKVKLFLDRTLTRHGFLLSPLKVAKPIFVNLLLMFKAQPSLVFAMLLFASVVSASSAKQPPELGEIRRSSTIVVPASRKRRSDAENPEQHPYESAFESLTQFQLFYCDVLKTSYLYSQNNLANTCLYQTHVFGSSVSVFLQSDCEASH